MTKYKIIIAFNAIKAKDVDRSYSITTTLPTSAKDNIIKSIKKNKAIMLKETETSTLLIPYTFYKNRKIRITTVKQQEK